MRPKIFFVREVNPQTSQLTCKIGVSFFVQEIHSSSQMKLKMIIRIESEATNIIINMQIICYVCGFSFYLKDYLKLHMTT